MNRRHLLATLAAAPAAALASFPGDRPASGVFSTPATSEPPIYDLMQMAKDYHPMSLLQRILELPADEAGDAMLSARRTYHGTPTGHVTCRQRMLRGYTAQYLGEVLYLPPALRHSEVAQLKDLGVTLHSVRFGQNITPIFTPGEEQVRWIAGVPYATLNYVLPNGKRFVFRANAELSVTANWGVIERPEEDEWEHTSSLLLAGLPVDLAMRQCRLDIAAPSELRVQATDTVFVRHELDAF